MSAPVRDADVFAAVRRIPRGRVATYGMIARLLGLPDARRVGYALARLGAGSTVPWHRVVNARGGVSVRSSGSGAEVGQRLALEREGVRFGPDDRIDLDRYGWRPRGRRSRGP